MAKKDAANNQLPAKIRVLLSWMGLNNDFERARDKAGKPDKSPAAVTGFKNLGPHSQLYMPGGMLERLRDTEKPLHYHFLGHDETNADIVKRFLIAGLDERRTKLGINLQPICVQGQVEDEENSAMRAARELHRRALERVRQDHGDDCDVELFVFVSPGLPVMQVCWGMLVWGGHLNAEMWRQTGLHEASANDRAQPWRLTRPVRFREFDGEVAQAESFEPPENVDPEQWELLQKYVKEREPILLRGEPGIGKTTLAGKIHKLSGRKGEFRRWTISGKGADLIEAELLGAAAGTYTGQGKGEKIGLLETCDGGTLLIDEVESGNRWAQTKLLEILDQPGRITTYRPMSATETKTSDVRFIFATNQDLPSYRDHEGNALRKDYIDRICSGIEIRMRLLDLTTKSDAELISTLKGSFEIAMKSGGQLMLVPPSWSDESLDFFRQEFRPLSYRVLDNFMRKLRVVLGTDNRVQVTHIEKALSHMTPEQDPRRKSKAAQSAAAAGSDQRPSPETGQPSADDPWSSALNGLLAYDNPQEVLRRIHESCSKLRLDYMGELDRQLKKHPEVMKHLKGLGIPTSAKRLGKSLKAAGLR